MKSFIRLFIGVFFKGISVIICFLLLIINVKAQVSSSSLQGSWIKTNVTFKNGAAVPDYEIVKSGYLRYTFKKPELISMCISYQSEETQMNFALTENVLDIKNPNGYITNGFLVEKATADELVLLQNEQGRFESPSCLRFYFIPEVKYQKSIPLSVNDIMSIKDNDTVFKVSEKIYPRYNGSVGLHDYLRSNIPEYENVSSTNAHLVATFIVNKNGVADSLHILQSINPSFDKQFVKAFNKVKKNWQPALHNNKPVAVQMTEEFRFVSSATLLPSYDYNNKAMNAFNKGQFDQALYYYDMALKSLPNDVENLYQRAVCKIALGNKTSACEDLKLVKKSGSTLADLLIEKNCN